MKRALVLIGALLIVSFVLYGFTVYRASRVTPPQPIEDDTPTTTFPVAESPQGRDPGTQEYVADATRAQVVTPLPLTLGETLIEGDYALQQWTDGYSGGEILLVNDPEEGWRVVPEATSVWEFDDLRSLGVPDRIARKLIETRGY